MKRSAIALAFVAVIAVTSLLTTSQAAQPQPHSQASWSGCCGVSPWSPGQRSTKGQWGVDQDAVGSSIARNHMAMGWGVPIPYDGLRNPLPKTRATIDRGASVYARSCAGCHGASGLGDGQIGSTLSPPPADLAWLSRMPVDRLDGYMFWTVAEGGAPLKTAMPSFKANLSKADTWAVIGYIRAKLPRRRWSGVPRAGHEVLDRE